MAKHRSKKVGKKHGGKHTKVVPAHMLGKTHLKKHSRKRA